MKSHRRLLSLLAALLVIGGGVLFLWRTGFFDVRSLNGMQRYIDRFSPYSQLVYFLVQLASVILAPIPSNLTAAAGALLFGSEYALNKCLLKYFPEEEQNLNEKPNAAASSEA